MTTKKELIETMTAQLEAKAEYALIMNGRDRTKAREDEERKKEYRATRDDFTDLLRALYPNSKDILVGFATAIHHADMKNDTRKERDKAQGEEVEEFKKTLEAYALFQ